MGKVVIVVNRRRLAGAVGQAVQKMLEDIPRFIREQTSVQVVDGSIDPVKRADIVNRFNQQTTPGVLVAVIDSIGETIDLHLVDAAVALSLPYVPGMLEQFEMRFARLGGKPCVIHYLVAVGTIDEEVRNVLLDKLADVVDLGTDTQGGDAIRRQLAGLDDQERVLDRLRSWLAEAG
jgi:SNF2 family DNA or RNA helicase